MSHELTADIVALLRSCTQSGSRTGQTLSVRHDNETTMLRPVVELLQVHNETAGGLIIFPPAEGLDDLDGMVAKAAKLALNVQVMRDHVRFRSEASSLTEVFKTLFAGAPRHPGELVARAQRLGVELPGPARLVTIALCGEGSQADDLPSSGLHLSLSRSAAALRPGAAVVVDDDLIVFAPVSAKEEPGRWDNFISGLLSAVESHTGTRAIAAESRVCRRLSDYREARVECGRIMTLARMFGRSGQLSQADFGPFAVLLSAVDQSSARDFVRHTLGAIEDYDARHGGELLPTLTQFVRDGCRYQSCADRLGIHVSTLRYRLGRLQELFAVDFEDPDSLFGLVLALRLRDLGSPSPSGSRPTVRPLPPVERPPTG